jgi:hypothetical protein
MPQTSFSASVSRDGSRWAGFGAFSFRSTPSSPARITPASARYGFADPSHVFNSKLMECISLPLNGLATRTAHSRLSYPQEIVFPAHECGFNRWYETTEGQVRARSAGRWRRIPATNDSPSARTNSLFKWFGCKGC